MADAPVLSPEWWLSRLHDRLVARRPEIDFYDDYYTGNHPLPFVNEQARDEFRRLVRMTRSNYMGLVCDATAERLSLEGFRGGADAESADKETWRIWQANDLDSEADMAWLEALISGVSYFHVAPNPADHAAPHIWVEHASQMIVEHEPGTNRHVCAAGLKVWDDDWTGEVHATLQLRADGGRIYKFKAKKPSAAGGILRWEEREVVGEQANGQRMNPLGVVSMVEIRNNPRLLPGGVSELYDLTDIQDRVNKTIFDRLQTQEFGIDPQKYASAFPDVDEAGNPNVVEFGRNRMVTTDIAETRFGNFAVAPLAPLLEAKREDVKDIASRSRTPAQYLLGEMSNVNGETLKASESGLISKTRQRSRPYGISAVTAATIARAAAGLPPIPLKAWWSDPQYRTEGERTDAIVKRLQSRIASLRQAREDYGYSAPQIERLEQEDAHEAMAPDVQQILSKVRTPVDVDDTGSVPPRV